jgi:hypothetical protein
METFIAFFDILGFKEIVNNNDLTELKRLFEHLLRDTQTAVSGETYVQMNASTIVPDLKNQKVNCLHISDSIVFWTNSNTEEDFKEIVSVCHSFYWRSLQTTFPLRGCLTYGEIDFNPDTIKNVGGVNFYNYSLIGRGLVDAYQKAEAIEYAGCLLDKLAIKKVSDKLINDLIYEQKICMYKVPFKTGNNYEHVFRPIKGNHNDVSFRNTANGIKRLFTYASKTDIDKMPESVKNKLNNTIDFISYFRETDKDLKTDEETTTNS